MRFVYFNNIVAEVYFCRCLSYRLVKRERKNIGVITGDDVDVDLKHSIT